jgi:16S rRNA (cytosine967-C5)-methyltransferase
MKLPGRIGAAIAVLADMEARHRPASEALRDWGLSHRFAGSGDRAVIGNLVYDALRRRASIGWRMGGETPWHLALGAVIFTWGEKPEALNAMFADDPHAPEPFPDALLVRVTEIDLSGAPDHVRADVPEWLAPVLADSLGADWVAECAALALPPPLDLRVNTLKADRESVGKRLARFDARPTPYSPVGLRIAPVAGARRHPHIQAEDVFQRGRIEVQDAGSQLCAFLVDAAPGMQILDLCAGAGGKTLALAAITENRGQIHATDADKSRLAPIFERLRRAGARNVQVHPPGAGLEALEGHMDRVLVDAPCTGTGIWRRRPDAKWRLTPEAVEKRTAEQDAVLGAAARYVKPGGLLVYATCSVLRSENEARVAAFLAAHPDFRLRAPSDLWQAALADVAPPAGSIGAIGVRLTPRLAETDGFFIAALARA